MHLHNSEWISLLAFSVFTALAWLRPLSRARRLTITAMGVGSLAMILCASLVPPLPAGPLTASAIRDWIPLALLALFYWLAGQFVTRSDIAIEQRLERWDRVVVAPPLEWCARRPVGSWILTYLEIAYMFYYVALPLAFAALFLPGSERQPDLFWTVVLLSAYGSCGALAFVQTRPPRAIGEKWSEALPSTKVRAFNRWILRRGSIHANTCPSAHVAIATACALALLHLAPFWVGLFFLWAAISIALGAVAGRYHYAADAILGALVAIVAFAAGLAL